MAEERAIHIASLVDNQLNYLSCTTPPGRCLFKVPSHLRRVKKEAYEPEMIAIGPYHHDKEHLQAMTEHKLRYLHQLLKRLNESSVAGYIQVLIKLEEKARQRYAEPITLDSDRFVEMLLLDGCFVVELIRKVTNEDLRCEDDPIFELEMMMYSVKHDLLLLENQLPFFILQELFDMTSIPDHESNFIGMIFRSFMIFPGPGYCSQDENAFQDVPHLLGLIHDNWLPSPEGIKAYRNAGEQDTEDTGRCLTLCPLDWLRLKGGDEENADTQSQFRCATELQEIGIKFERAEECSLFDIKFENGTLKIPKLTIEDRTESFLRNLIAYEQFSKVSDHPYHVIDYTMFMDCLINTEKDVELLCQCGIIDNWLGNDEVVANIFNKLLDNVRLYHKSSYYANIYEKVNKYCSRRWNVWKANLKHDYFNSPWALISFLAAVLLLILTVLQTIYTVLSYYQ